MFLEKLEYEWKSRIEVFGLPLVHIAIGRDRGTGKLMVAEGIIAIGQMARGVVAVAQFGIGVIAIGQFVAGILTLGQFAMGIYFSCGQFASGLNATGQFASVWGDFFRIKFK